MRAEQILPQMSLLVLLLMFDNEGHSRLAEGKTLQKFAHDKKGSPPTFIKSLKGKTIREGKGLSLTCSVTGKPKPRIKWKKDGRTILTDDRITIRNMHKLRIKNAGPQDSGIYHCFAKNRHGQSNSEKAKVTVLSDGTCKPYNGTICSRYISKDTKVFVQQLRPQRESEKKIIHAASVLTGYMSTQCKDSLLRALCYNLFAPCQGGKHRRSPRRLCKDDCEVIQGRACSKEIKFLNEKLGGNADEIIPNCSSLPFQSTVEAKNCLPIRNKMQTCETSKDPFQANIKPLKRTFSICSKRFSRIDKIYNKEVLSLVKNVKAELHNGNMALESQSMELSTYCLSASLPLSKLVRDWTAYFRTPLLPNLPRPYNLTVLGLEISMVNSSVGSIWVPLGYAAIYTVHRKITLRNVTFFYRHQSGHGSFIAKGKYNICDTVFDMTVESLPDGNVKLSGNSETPIDVSTIENAFVSASPSSMLVKAIEKVNLFVLRLMRPSMEAYINKDLIVKFSGKSYLYMDTSTKAVPITLEIFGGKWGREDVLLAGITSSRITMNQALHLFTSLSLPYLDMHASNESRVGIVLSAQALDLSKSPYEIFKEAPLAHAFADTVPDGLSLVTSGAIPVQTHKDNQVCQLFQTIFGRGSELTLKASTNWASISLDWHFINLAAGALSPFDRVEMKMKINDTRLLKIEPLGHINIPLSGILYKKGQRLDSWDLSGQLTYRGLKANLEANFKTRSAWRKALGMEYLTMKNLQLGLSLPIGQSQKSSATGQAELQLGSLCNAARNRKNESVKKSCVTGHLSLGLSDKSADRFFYGSLSPVSLQKLLEVCNINHKLPVALATIGFPEGLKISAAKGAHNLSVLGGPTIKPGFILSGKMSLFGIETTGAVSLLPEEFVIDAKIKSDEDLATMDDITLSSSSTAGSNLNSKLYLTARMDSVPSVKAHLDGFPRLFGIFKDVQMLATRDSLQIHLASDVNKSYKIDVHLITNYSANRNDTQFNAMVVFDNGLSKLTRLASDYVVSMLESEMSRLKSAKSEVQRLRRECNKTIKRECFWCLNHGVCASSFSDAQNTTQKKRGTPRIGSPLDICHQVVMKRCLVNSGYHNVCRFVSANLSKTCAIHRSAARSQKDLEKGLRWVKEADQLMYSELLQLHSISFKTNVTSTNLEKIYLETTLELTIFGQKQRLEGRRMDFNEFMKFSSEIAKYAVDWYQKTQPQSKPKLRHPDNRPRSPTW